MSSCLHQAARSILSGLTALIAPAGVSDNSGVGPERRFDPAAEVAPSGSLGRRPFRDCNQILVVGATLST